MRRWILIVMVLSLFAMPVQASELTAPRVPDSGEELMPETESFTQGLMDLLEKGLQTIHPDLYQAMGAMAALVASALIVGMVSCISGETAELAELAGAVCICAAMFLSMNSMIRLGAQTVTDISEYGKLLLPVLAAALAAQGGIAASGALYAGTAAFNTLLSGMISKVLIPMVYLFLGFSAALAMTGEGSLKQMRDLTKTFLSWCLKTILTVFTTYMAITGVVSGTTDAAALKATKVTISSFVPVVGGRGKLIQGNALNDLTLQTNEKMGADFRLGIFVPVVVLLGGGAGIAHVVDDDISDILQFFSPAGKAVHLNNLRIHPFGNFNQTQLSHPHCAQLRHYSKD